ncbi:hypothetical protein FACS1894199_04640 [Bacteroidia bacterium]|nr:hypothetical protein FACS1894199_04640 [Bacteroidia bacterium]
MEEIKLAELSAEKCRKFEVNGTANLLDLFRGSFIDQLFLTHFNKVPNTMTKGCIDCKRANEWFFNTYRAEIIDCHYTQDFHYKKKKFEYENTYYLLHEDLLVYFNFEDSGVTLLFRKTDVKKVREIMDGIMKFKETQRIRTSKIRLLINGNNGLDTTTMNISRPKLTIDDNYNDDFLAIHQTILKRLQTKEDKGLVLLHGKPGTGKTSYIRHLLTKSKKKVVFLPPNMAGAITDPGLIKILVQNPNSIFVIEDAENIVIDRNRSGHSPVSALLNLADGLLSDCLNIQIICSFNTDLSRVDNALMRKGRLIAEYEFKELEVEKAQALSNKLGFSSVIETPMVLTDVYNQKEMSFQQPTLRRAIGF